MMHLALYQPIDSMCNIKFWRYGLEKQCNWNTWKGLALFVVSFSSNAEAVASVDKARNIMFFCAHLLEAWLELSILHS